MGFIYFIISAEVETEVVFSHICDEYKIKWLVVRGISDYGGLDKNSKQNKKYQIFAAISAMIAIKLFLEEELTME